jgi:hypothetical protein
MNDDLRHRAARRQPLLDQIAKAQSELKAFKAEDKDDGYNEKALGAVLKGLRKGPEAHADQLLFELEVSKYREGVGLTTDASEAQDLAQRAARGDTSADPLTSLKVLAGDIAHHDMIERVGVSHGLPRDLIDEVKAEHTPGVRYSGLNRGTKARKPEQVN